MATKKKINVCLLFGGQTSEHAISILSAEQIFNNLDYKKYNVILCYINKKGLWNIGTDIIKDIKSFNKTYFESFIKKINQTKIYEVIKEMYIQKIDVVFNVIHGETGEDGTIDGFFNILKIPVTSAGVLSSAITIDKIVFKEMMVYNNILTPEFMVILKKDFFSNKQNWINRINQKLSIPLVLKVPVLGSSKGIEFVLTKDDLNKKLIKLFNRTDIILVEKCIKGREFTCGIINNIKEKKHVVLTPTEIIPITSDYFDYSAKYSPGATDEITPADISTDLETRIKKLSNKIYKLCYCNNAARIDYMYSEDKLYVLELNTIPGMTQTSLLPQGAKHVGINYTELLTIIIESALNKE